ncbi:MAG TPA: zinc ribbon domain-containing protein [Candidatus Ozemobacteraceae bacterium]|nr:zinc ribbon domain-containing protein [Candidatus Ozemobacteraceae bacterium]
MPIYEWICQSCSQTFETNSSMRELTRPDCPTCHGSDVRRRFSATVGVIIRPSASTKVCRNQQTCQGPTPRCDGHTCERK